VRHLWIANRTNAGTVGYEQEIANKPQGLKPALLRLSSARLESCPDTKPVSAISSGFSHGRSAVEAGITAFNLCPLE
jgi:hypothetical protein